VKRGIAFFDFDGTITRKDSLLEFIRFTKGNASYYSGFFLHLPHAIAYKLKWMGNQAFKEKMLQYFYKGTSLNDFLHQCNSFSRLVLPKIVRPKAMEEINRLQREGVKVVIVTASPEEYLKCWADPLNIQVIGSRMEVKDQKMTGKLHGLNCHGKEKVRRILQHYKLEEYEPVYAYGDTKGDLPMLKLAAQTFYKPFRK
jgi:HAD superfamily hydrolase (TIGR01490 family)